MRNAVAEHDIGHRESGGLMALLKNHFGAGPAKPGDSFGAPGQGKSAVISVATVVTLLALWTLVTNLGLIQPLFLPTPQAVIHKFYEVAVSGFGGGTLLEHTLASMSRVFGAFAVAVVTAIPIGVMMGVNRVMRGIFDPPVEFYRPIPPLAYLPLAIIWFGIGEESKVILIFLSMFAPMCLNARAGVRSVSIEQIHAAYAMGANRGQVIMQVILMGAMPEIITGMRIGIGFGWTTLVAAEMVAAKQGLGYMVLNASEFLVTDVVFMGIIVIGLIALGFDIMMRFLERWLVPWKGKV